MTTRLQTLTRRVGELLIAVAQVNRELQDISEDDKPMPPVPATPLLTLDQVAEQLHVSRRTARRYVATGRLKARKVGGKLLVSQDAIAGGEA
jgi:excisionase family DNA binding protein